MLGLVLLILIYFYLWISIRLVEKSSKLAKVFGISGWVFGLPIALLMYNLAFWDWLPTVIVHKYLCENDSGFYPKKTFEEWNIENPGAVSSLKRSLEPSSVQTNENSTIYWLTQRFYYEKVRENVFLSVEKTEKKFFDADTDELIARSINYTKGHSGNVISLGGTPNEIRSALIFGWGNRQCGEEGASPTDEFTEYIYQFWKRGKDK